MNVLIIDFFGINNSGGTDRLCSMLANGLSKANHKITVASTGACDKPFFPINKDIKIIPLASFPRSNLGRLPITSYDIRNLHNTIYRIRNKLCDPPNIIYKIRKLVKKECIDIVISLEMSGVEFILPAIIGLSVKYIGWEAFNINIYKGEKIARMRRLAVRYCDVIVTQTKGDSKLWLESTNRKLQVITIANPCPFLIQEYTKENTKTVLAVGRLTYQKGFDLLLESWVQVAKVMPDWTLTIIGNGEDKAKLTEFIERKHLSDSVKLVGSTNDLTKYYKEAEIFCLSSRYEGFGIVLIEALAFGLPIVSFDCDFGPAEILEDTGSILVPKNDIDKLTLSLIELMKDNKQRKTISLKAKEKVKIYENDKIISQWVSLLESFECNNI